MSESFRSINLSHTADLGRNSFTEISLSSKKSVVLPSGLEIKVNGTYRSRKIDSLTETKSSTGTRIIRIVYKDGGDETIIDNDN